MNREEKIRNLAECLEEYHVSIIDTENIKGIVIDAEVNIDTLKEDLSGYDENKGITDDDLDNLFVFLEDQGLVLVNLDSVTGVSFENCEYSMDALIESILWEDEEENSGIEEEVNEDDGIEG